MAAIETALRSKNQIGKTTLRLRLRTKSNMIDYIPTRYSDALQAKGNAGEAILACA
jgi:hypothetical protein